MEIINSGSTKNTVPHRDNRANTILARKDLEHLIIQHKSKRKKNDVDGHDKIKSSSKVKEVLHGGLENDGSDDLI